MAQPRTLLVGTVLSVRQLHHTLAVVDPPPQVIGCLLPRSAVVEADLPIPVLGDFDSLAEVLDRTPIDQVLVSLPLAWSNQIAPVTDVLNQAGVTWRFLPTFADQFAGRFPVPGSTGPGGYAAPDRPFDAVQLLDRQPRPLDHAAIRSTLADRVVMITGAGGSIGSELARIVGRFAPARLILVERAENALFQIDQQIGRIHPDLARQAVLHDVTDVPRTRSMVERHRPHVLFHAAAHKHVPMMEDHPAQAVENNFYGTRSIADAADACGTDRFVMISTDKAVNPTSVMGATKRLAELYVQHLGTRSKTTFSMVRFGNVLGSAGSVLTIWSEQLAHGGPITVTHPDMVRYFMTIPEAAGLVIQSAALSAGGEIFLLDMGEPIRILDMAQRFLQSRGLEPGLDARIDFIGIRPGEKLFEELAYDGEDMIRTPHESIRIWRTTPPDAAHMQQIITAFDRLRMRPEQGGHDGQHAGHSAIVTALRTAIPEMVTAAAG